MNSIQDLAIPDRTSTLARDAPVADVDAIFQRLRDLKFALYRSTNADNRLMAIIAACIDEGINTSDRILGTARRLGFDLRHTRRVLHSGIGHTWIRATNDQFSNLI